MSAAADPHARTGLPCPVCGRPMVMLYGCHWDYDRWICMRKMHDPTRCCPGEIELDTSTDPPGGIYDG